MEKNQVKTAARKKAAKEFIIGLAVAILGAGISFASYSTARAGETYTVYTGIIVLGAIYACKGLFGLVFPMGLKKSKEATELAVVEADAKDDKQDEK